MTFDLLGHLALLDVISTYKPEYDAFTLDPGTGPEPHVHNQLFCSVDAEVLYGLVRHFQPSHMIEIGSGYSTLFTLAALRRNATACEFTAIDPEPRIWLGDQTGVWIMPKRVEDVPADLFYRLGAGDVLFIDSSHTWTKGGDLDVEYGLILPALPSGVIVHIHDVFLPDGYPEHWADWGFDEHEYVAPLLADGEYDVLWSGHFMDTAAPGALEAAFRSYSAERHPASLWLRKR